jgi:glycine betaine/proline transport system substrate-binding protein
MNKKRYRATSLAAIGLAGLLAFGVPISQSNAQSVPETIDPIKIPYFNFSDSDFILTVLGGILERMGYNVEYVTADYIAAFTAVETGDLHVFGAWESTGWELLNDIVDAGRGINFGPVIQIDEGWWYPKYMEEICPGLPDWEALKNEACVEALVVAETEPLARFIDAPAEWGSGSAELIDNLGLEFEAISSGSPGAMVASIQGVLERNEPVIGWGFQPHWLYPKYDGNWIDFPDKIESGYAWKLGNKEMMDRVPAAKRMLYLFRLPNAAVDDAMARADLNDEDSTEIAEEWINNNEHIWRTWIR